jgi:UDP-N-acetylbacillosamine N-acetyltransferase
MSEPIHIIGAGGNSRPVIQLLLGLGFNVGNIYDDSFDPNKREEILGCWLSGNLHDVPTGQLVLAVGDNQKRKDCARRFSSQLMENNLIHPSSIVESSAKLGASNILMARSYVSAMVQIGSYNLINSGAIIEHESIVGNHCHISVGAIVCGRVKIGDLCFVGAGAVIKDSINICDNVTIGAGAVVIRDITEPGVYVGNPAKRIK